MTFSTLSVPGLEFRSDTLTLEKIPPFGLPVKNADTTLETTAYRVLAEGGNLLGAEAGYVSLQSDVARLVYAKLK